ncbi:MAG: hypothetical protein K8U03_05905 [Planctomycetia bacterium]|nr:hypothetical protein [Planctomycetia bacterium]
MAEVLPDEPPPVLSPKIIEQGTVHDSIRLALVTIYEMRRCTKNSGIPFLARCRHLVTDGAVRRNEFFSDDELVRRLGTVNDNRVVDFYGYSGNSWAEVGRKIVDDWTQTMLNETFEVVDGKPRRFWEIDEAAFKLKWSTLSVALATKRVFSFQKLEAELVAEERRLAAAVEPALKGPTGGRNRDPYVTRRADFAKPFREQDPPLPYPQILEKYQRKHRDDTQVSADTIRLAYERRCKPTDPTNPTE